MGTFLKKFKWWFISLSVAGLVYFVGIIEVPNPLGPKKEDSVPKKEREISDDPAPYSPGIKDNTDDTTPGRRKIKVITLTDDNTVSLYGEVNLGSIEVAIEELNQKKKKNPERIYLVITSPGGSVLAGAMLLSAIEGSDIPVDTVCVALCASMGAQIHAMGEKRYMTDRSSLMFHPAAGGFQGEFDTMISRMNYLNRYISKMDAYVARRTGIPYDEFKKRIRNELWLDSQEATDENFNDAIAYIEDNREKVLFFELPGGENKASPAEKFFKNF